MEQKRKSRLSTINPSKLMILSKPSNSTKPPRLSREECPIIIGTQTDGAASLIRRNSARLLSFIRWKSSNGQQSSKESPQSNDRSGSLSPRLSSDSRRSGNLGFPDKQQMMMEPVLAAKKMDIDTHSETQPLLDHLAAQEIAEQSKQTKDKSSLPDQHLDSAKPSSLFTVANVIPVEASHEPRKRAYGALKGKGLAPSSRTRQLSHRISTVFGNTSPTVVHRASLRSRPSIATINIPNQQVEITSLPPGDTDPSSHYAHSDSGSPLDPSTGKTSLNSKSLSRSSKGKISSDKGNPRLKAVAEEFKEPLLTPIEEVPIVVTPTVVTTETTSNAKIFFETHFNSILGQRSSPRDKRRRELELRLMSEPCTPEQRQKERLLWARQESEHLRQSRALKSKINQIVARNGVQVAGFEVVRVLGKGSFGVVRLVRQIDESPMSSNIKLHPRDASGKVYAMKVIRKSDMLRNCQEGHLRAERDFLIASESEKSKWVIPLFASFQDNTNLYLVMEYMVGGDFLGLLFRKDVIKEKKARWYIAEMILCVEEAHRLRWIHRDVKPDNFLISASGHLKISDFGLAFDGHWQHDQSYFNNHRQSLMEKLGITVEGDTLDRKEGAKVAANMALANVLTNRKEPEQSKVAEPTENETILDWRNRVGKRHLARSVVGTSQYMAPEVIRGDEYDGRCDWWSIGIILYECLYGFTPFVCDNRQDTKRKILANKTSLQFPPSDPIRGLKVSYEALDLMNSLLQEKEHRLSSKKYAANDLCHFKRHHQHRSHQHGYHHLPHRSKQSSRTSSHSAESRDWKGHYVYSEDAADIKAHPFFHGICWERLHLSRPPFVPDVRGNDDTRYFDEEASVSDIDDASSDEDAAKLGEPLKGSDEATPTAGNTPRLDGAAGGGGADSMAITEADIGLVDVGDAPLSKTTNIPKLPVVTAANIKKEKKRPRDRLLRDKLVGRQVLELRKKGAFIGYTYRRADIRALREERDWERGRQGLESWGRGVKEASEAKGISLGGSAMSSLVS